MPIDPFLKQKANFYGVRPKSDGRGGFNDQFQLIHADVPCKLQMLGDNKRAEGFNAQTTSSLATHRIYCKGIEIGSGDWVKVRNEILGLDEWFDIQVVAHRNGIHSQHLEIDAQRKEAPVGSGG